MPTGFFDLPQELRDQIYQELWRGESIVGLYGHNRVTFSSTARSDKIWPEKLSLFMLPEALPMLPQWLLTCKSILAEA